MNQTLELFIYLATLTVGICTTGIALGMGMIMQGSILRSVARISSIALALFTVAIYIGIRNETLTQVQSLLFALAFGFIVLTLRRFRLLST